MQRSPPADGEPEMPAEREEVVLTLLRAKWIAGSTPPEIAGALGWSEDRVRTVVTRLVERERAIALDATDVILAAAAADDLYARTIERLEQRERDRPWLMGSTSIALAQTLGVVESRLVAILASYVAQHRLAYRDGYYATLDFTPRLTVEQRAFFDSTFRSPDGTPVAPIAIDNLRGRMRGAAIPELAAALETLLLCGELVRVDTFIYLRSRLDELRAQLEAEIRTNGPITVARFRDATGLSRKFAVPLLTYFDARGITERSGDMRTLRSADPAAAGDRTRSER